ncbi:alpha-glucan family phosphorylase [Oscillatoria laete-virens NRMC-F 0139]|nr:alpha-glucan family phosphorylase [Oscillatoria laete-virens]MDL5055212.1 alpha-glucan family phosphorylase [Oscillatoria laete-virens NRMC-F 0139]
MNSPLTFSVVPQIPARIEALRDIAYNLWWTWTPEASELFRDLDPELWVHYHHNPAQVLRYVTQSRLQQVAQDGEFVARLDAIKGRLDAYLGRKDRWFAKHHGDKKDLLVAYFSAEFGIHEALPIYSGGLGILAGDHCKSASDLGIPFVACGILYRTGYFKQRITKDGWQQSDSIVWNFYELPISEVTGADGKPVQVSVRLPGRDVQIKVWRAAVGNIGIYLLDTDVAGNSEEDRKITYQLYGGDHEMRIKQEIVLGIGGVRALQAAGLQPTVYHMNEGHAAFLGLERIRQFHKKDGLKFHEALQVVAASNIFTTHTPVAAGNDAFAVDLVRRYFGEFVGELGVDFDAMMKLGRPWHGTEQDPFSMTILGLRLSRQANGVSALHGEVSRGMWQTVWPGVPKHEIPITSITNGVHTQTWMSPEFRRVLEQYIGAIWEDNVEDIQAWNNVENIPDEEIWKTHCSRKLKLIEKVRSRVQNQRLREGYLPEEIAGARKLLDPHTLTIGFARRFATYKRATLLFKDPERLKAIMNNPARPVQFVFAGKSHPADEPGKKFLQQVYKMAEQPDFKGKVIFVEDYDIDLARYLISGVDVWLNNPIRPLEASGTSGQKGPINGIINFSILDGWWCEGYNGKNGWAINPGVTANDPAIQDEFDAHSLYTILEHHIIPDYYDRDHNGTPHKWIRHMKESMKTVSPQFSTFRMVQDYCNRLYTPACVNSGRIAADGFKIAKELSTWKEFIRNTWYQVKVNEVIRDKNVRQMQVGAEFEVKARITLGTLKPSDVVAEAYVEALTNHHAPYGTPLQVVEDLGNGNYLFGGKVKAHESGSYHFNVRVIPYHPGLVQKNELRLTAWCETF